MKEIWLRRGRASPAPPFICHCLLLHGCFPKEPSVFGMVATDKEVVNCLSLVLCIEPAGTGEWAAWMHFTNEVYTRYYLMQLCQKGSNLAKVANWSNLFTIHVYFNSTCLYPCCLWVLTLFTGTFFSVCSNCLVLPTSHNDWSFCFHLPIHNLYYHSHEVESHAA